MSDELTGRAETLMDDLMAAVRQAAELGALLATNQQREVMMTTSWGSPDVLASIREAQKQAKRDAAVEAEADPPLVPIEDVRADNDRLRIENENLLMSQRAALNERDRYREQLREVQTERDQLKARTHELSINQEVASAVRKVVQAWGEMDEHVRNDLRLDPPRLGQVLDDLAEIWGPTT